MNDAFQTIALIVYVYGIFLSLLQVLNTLLYHFFCPVFCQIMHCQDFQAKLIYRQQHRYCKLHKLLHLMHFAHFVKKQEQCSIGR